MTHSFMKQLNPAQHAAVVSQAQVEAILAGPGSGKTRVLTSRVAWLVSHEHADPSRIVVVTFTNKAAREMRERLESPELLGRLYSDQLLMGTFHSLCAQLLRKHGGLVGIKKNFTIADNELRPLIEKYYNEISRAKNSGMTVDTYIAENKDKFGKKDFCIMFQYISTGRERVLRAELLTHQNAFDRAYEKRLKAENLVDFDNLLVYGRDLVKRFPAVVDFVTHVLVDEFQDTNVVQYDFVTHLTGTRKSLTIVGGKYPDQSIFGWRCADKENFNRMVKQYPECDIKNLEENYRSTQSILTGATHVIKLGKYTSRIEKTLFTGNHTGVPISFLRYDSDLLEAGSVAEEIKRVVNASNGLITYKDIAVLMRVNWMSRNVEQSLSRDGIPYAVVGGVKFFDRAEVKDIISYVRFFHNTNDTEAFERIINKPRRGIGAVSLKKMQTLSRQQDWNVIRVLRAIVDGKDKHGITIASKTKEGIRDFLQLYSDYKELVRNNEPISVILEYIVDAIDYKSFLAMEHPDKSGESRWDNVGELVTFAKAGFDMLSKRKASNPAPESSQLRDELEDRLFSDRLVP
ncbi:P-loop containing nucleoside triphosphate hydrolase protein [Dichotomocladium elegans]|nr:P-loop containing nucleoside triphosphate hydrolase protein [Dichotomocladium elegans]